MIFSGFSPFFAGGFNQKPLEDPRFLFISLFTIFCLFGFECFVCKDLVFWGSLGFC